MKYLQMRFFVIVGFLVVITPLVAFDNLILKGGVGLFFQHTDSYYTDHFIFSTFESENTLGNFDYSVAVSASFPFYKKALFAPELTYRSIRFNTSCKADDEDLESGKYKLLVRKHDNISLIELAGNTVFPVVTMANTHYCMSFGPLLSIPVKYVAEKNDYLSPEISDLQPAVGGRVSVMAITKHAVFELYTTLTSNILKDDFNAEYSPNSFGVMIGYQFQD